MIKKLIENVCVCVVVYVLFNYNYCSTRCYFMSSSRDHLICCCCPKRVETPGTFKTIGSDTVHKFTPHARATITKDETRACNKCYKQHTRTKKTKVSQIAAQCKSSVQCYSHVHLHYECMAAWAAVWPAHLCIHMCYRTHLLHTSIHWLMWPLIFNMIMMKIIRSTNMMIR